MYDESKIESLVKIFLLSKMKNFMKESEKQSKKNRTTIYKKNIGF